MTVRFYNAFSKRKNSTKKPANTDTHYDINVVLKEDTTIENPSIILTNPEGTASGNPVTVSALGGNMVSPIVIFNPIQDSPGSPIYPYNSINIGVNGNDTIINLNDNVYGGILNVSTGEMIIKYACVNLGDQTWYKDNATYPRFLCYTLGGLETLTNTPIKMFFSNSYYQDNKIFNVNNSEDGTAGFYTNGYLYIRDSTYNTPTDFKNAMNGIYLCYELATYQTVQLTPTQIALFNGANTVTVNGNSTISFGYTAEEIATDYVYAYIPKWDKYYFISTPAIITNYHVQYDLEEDYLASRKTEVGSTVAHIAYSSTGWNKDITDNRIAVKGTKTIYHDSQALPLEGGGTGCYIIGVVNSQNDGSKTGALSYYRMAAYELALLIKYMMNKDIWDVIKEYFNGKTMDFIQSCIWVPHTGAGFVGTMQTTFYVGDTAIADYSTVPATPLYITHYPITTKVLSLGMTSVSLGSKFQDFRDNQPYSSASLYLPGVGLTDLNINDFYESNNVNIETILDITTGDVTYKIYDDSNQLLKTVSFNASASVSMSQINMNAAGAIAGIGGVIGGVVGMGLSALTMNPVAVAGAGVGVLAGASAAVMAANQRSTSIKGTNSGRSGFFTNSASTVVVRQDTEDPDDANYIARCGRPVAATHAISNHSGYVQCEGASVSIAGDNSERDAINNYLNSGFYYE